MEREDRLMLAQVDVSIRSLERTMAKAGITIDRSTDRMGKRWERMNRRMTASSNQMARDLRSALAGVAVMLSGRELIQYADAWTEAGNKIAAAGTPLDERADQLNKLADLAIATRSSFEATAMLRARLGIATEDLVGKEYDLLKVTELVNKATVAGGSGDQERRSTILQLSQALASGELMGEELRSLRENAPLLLRAIADEFQVPIGALKELGAQGKLTSERILDAIINAEDEISARFDKTTVTIGDSFTNLQTRVTQYIGTVDESLGASEKLSGTIMYIADNLDMFADALVVVGAALTGALGAASMGMAIKGLMSVGAILWGPGGLILGAGALAAAMAYLAVRGDDVARAMDKVEAALARHERVSQQLQSDTAELADLQDKLRDAIENQQPIIEATARADIAALNNRIAKNKELQEVLAVTARAELARLRGEDANAASAFAGYRATQNFSVEGDGRAVAGINRGDSGISVLARDAAESARLVEQLEAKILDHIKARVDAGELITKQEQNVLDNVAEQLQRRQRIASLAKQVAELESGVSASPPPPPAPPRAPGTTISTEDAEEVQRVLDEIRDAHRALYETERQQIARTLEENLAAIEKLKVAESEKEAARVQARETAAAELRAIEAEEAERLQEAKNEKKAARDEELSLIASVMDSRDRALGRLASILDREYALKRQQIDADIANAEERNDALLALEEERVAAEKDLRDQLLEEGTYSRDPLEQFRAYMEERQTALLDGLELEKITWQEYLEELAALKQEYRDLERENEIANQQTILSATQGFLAQMSSLAEQRFGKNSALAKAAFIAEKLAAAAQVVLRAEVAKMRALAELGPIAGPPAAGAIEVAKNISLATIAAQTVAGFKDGVIGIRGPGTGRSDSIGPVALSNDESVISARGTRKNRPLLRLANRGIDVAAMMKTVSAPTVVRPQLYDGGGRSISVGDTFLSVEGSISEDTLPDVQQMLADHRREIGRQIERMINKSWKDRQPKHQRHPLFDG